MFHRSGDWTDETLSRHSTSLAELSRSNSTSILSQMFNLRNVGTEQYLTWVKEGVPMAGRSPKFEVDGRAYVFSALRPDPSPAGSLKLRTINMMLLNVMVCIFVGILGLVLIRAKWTLQLAGVLFVLAAFVFVGLFFPLITEHLFGEALLAMGIVIGVIWIAAKFSHLFDRFQAARRDFFRTVFWGWRSGTRFRYGADSNDRSRT